jgi:UDP-N-acetylmuramyl pentapeptide phosphotransferase/UDP-N-acetylglucosamine-1-phosphate transferase
MQEKIMINHLVATTLITGGLSAVAAKLIVASQKWHGKHTLDHDLDAVQKFHTVAVPRIGGAAVVSAIFVTLLLCAWFAPDSALPGNLSKAALLLIASLPVFVAGITEDLTKRVSVRTRLVASIASALLASWLLGATVDQLDIWGVDSLLTWLPFALAVTAVTVAGGINSINIIDGFNGLAASTVVIMLGALAFVGWAAGDIFVVELCVLGIGAAIGFLLVNYPTGRLFLGDGGAYFLGFWVAEIVVLLLVRNGNVNAWQVLSICAYPVIEVLYSIYRRRIVRQASPGAPDGLHMHTLVYRRVVPRLFAADAARPWARNAAVVGVIAPCIGAAAVASVLFGATISGAIAIVFVQVLAYIVVYARLVRGRWFSRETSTATAPDGARAKG